MNCQDLITYVTVCRVAKQFRILMPPSAYLSGQLEKCYFHVEKRGSQYLRYALHNAAKCVCHWDPAFAYLARKRSEGKHYSRSI